MASTHTIGQPMAFECECGAKFMLAKWSKDALDNYTVEHISHKSEFYVCPFCGGKTSQMEVAR